MPILTDSQLAIYRPWAWIQIGDLKINYPEGPDEKFRYLKDFRWTIGETQGSSVEFTIFDNAPQSYNNDWFSFLRTHAVDENNLMLKFQWGISGRTQEGVGVRGFPIEGGFHASRIHEMIMTGVDLEYVEGGANYRFHGADPFAITQTITNFDKIKDATFKEAVKKIVSIFKEDRILPPDFNVTYAPEIDKFFPTLSTVKRDWVGGGFAFLLVLHKWMFSVKSPQNIDKPDKTKIGWAVYPITVKGRAGIHFTTANYISGEMDTGLEIHVNPPDTSPLGVGKHTAISFRPQFNSSAYWALSPQLSAVSAVTRSIIHAGDQIKDKNMRKGEGMPSAQPGNAPDDAFTTKDSIEGVKSQVAGAAANDGSLFTPAAAEVELLGIPDVDELSYLGKTIKLFVWNPAYLNIAGARNPITGATGLQGGMNGWDRNPPLDSRWPPTMKITGISQYISTEGVFSTSFKLIPTGDKDYPGK